MNRLKFISDLTIKNKMILIVLLVTFLVHSIGFVFIYVWDINRIKSEMQTGLVLNTKLIANNCVVPLTFGDDQQATEALSHLENIVGFETACLRDKAGNVFATHPRGLNKKDLPVCTEEQQVILKDGFFYVKAPVMFQNIKYGTLFIKANSRSLKRAKWSIILTLLLLSLVLNLLAIFLASRMQRYISKPIVKLKNHLETLTRTQDFSLRIEKRNNDEVGHLYDEFNSLINQIQNRRIERDSAEKQLRESQEKLDLALHGGGIGVWEWDPQTDRREWDPKMEKMFGLEVGTFKKTTKAFKACLHPDDLVLAEEAIQDALNGVAPYDFIYRVVWKNKEIKFIRA
ncbi:MAG: PAS domain-containing protein, partial [Bacteroidales bacterium]|nr:PAS domain-containing protein [Bacteroidales bacterium]